MRLGATKTGATTTYNGLGDQLYDLGGARPTLDLNFASNGSLVDSVTGKTLVTHTRQSNATYVDGDGIIKDAVTNLVLRSEDYSTGWSQVDIDSVTADAITAPDNKSTAMLVVPSTATTNRLVQQNTGLSTSTTYTLSVYLKSNGITSTTFRYYSIGTSFNSVEVDLSAGTISNSQGTTNDEVIENVGNGWYRCSFSFDSGTDLTSAQVQIARNSTPNDGTNGIYIWGVQLEQSSTAGEYVKTTSTINSAPRFDHNPTTGESLGLLVEESRTNLMPYSVATTTDWSSSGGTLTDLSLNALGVFPGVRCASGGLVYHGLNTGQITGLTNGATYTATFWFRAGDTDPSNMVRFILRNDTTAAPSTIQKNSRSTAFDSISSYTASDSPVGTSTSSLTVLSVETLADGLTYKLVASFVFEGSSTDAYKFGIHTNSATTGETVIALGMQLEQGSFATSYIPTSGSSATRSADVASITGTNFSSWYNQTEGTVFAEADGSGPLITSRATASASDRIQVAIGSSAIVVSNSVVATFNNTTAAKRALAYELNNTNAAFDGAIGVNDTSCTIPSVDYATIGRFDFGGQQVNNGAIKRITFWPTRLSNDTLQTITR